MRIYPAYARTIASHIGRGQKPICVAVLLSARWGYFDQVPKVCIKPDEWQRGRFEFGYLAGMHAVAVQGDDCSDAMLAELLVELMRAGPQFLWVFGAEGEPLYDGSKDNDWPSTLAHWAFELSKRALSFEEAKKAAEVMEAAQQRASRRWLVEFERIRARSEDDALQFHLQAEGQKRRVRELFARTSEPAGA